jgi:hypothetical protein
MLAYHARATTVTLDVIYFERGYAKLREISEDFNLNLFSNRINLVVALRNVGRILNSLVGRTPGPYLPEFEKIERSNGVKLENTKTTIEKEWPREKAKHIKVKKIDLKYIYANWWLRHSLKYLQDSQEPPLWYTSPTFHVGYQRVKERMIEFTCLLHPREEKSLLEHCQR